VTITIEKATSDHAPAISILVGELLKEIMDTIGVEAFNFNLEETTERLRDFIDTEKYFVFIAQDSNEDILGFISLYESYALYAEGAFGTIPELYVRPAHRSKRIGSLLLSETRLFGATRGWKRLEVTTPPLPQFEKTLAFYEREGFEISGGRKLKTDL
jgi:GNAT superfamily N-acetyltransferase